MLRIACGNLLALPPESVASPIRLPLSPDALRASLTSRRCSAPQEHSVAPLPAHRLRGSSSQVDQPAVPRDETMLDVQCSSASPKRGVGPCVGAIAASVVLDDAPHRLREPPCAPARIRLPASRDALRVPLFLMERPGTGASDAASGRDAVQPLAERADPGRPPADDNHPAFWNTIADTLDFDKDEFYDC